MFERSCRSPTIARLIATPSTQESLLAGYLDSWRRRVERIGTTHFPSQFLDDRDLGRPTLEVTIASDGRLEDIVVRRSSGDKALDQAALRILRLAAPFDALPDHIRAQYDQLSFAYEWDFFSGIAADVRGQRRPSRRRPNSRSRASINRSGQRC